MSEYVADEVLDATGLFCPEPVMLLHAKVAEMQGGQVLEIRATDPSTQRDIPKFCQFLGHELLEAGEADQIFVYRIRIQSS
ncbi:MAG: sulfurtransferase TusA [Gammaproteobacteria bacterium]|nr:MAG: sulfurtransferase TusA [Gammaproteobacteria bacterium]